MLNYTVKTITVTEITEIMSSDRDLGREAGNRAGKTSIF